MNPIKIGKATLFNADCMDYMATVPDRYFDLAIVDPPYFDGPNKSGYYGKGYSSIGVKRAKHYDSLSFWKKPDEAYFAELARISKNQIIWGGNYFVAELKQNSAGWIVWDKDNGKSSFADAELAYSSFDRALRIFKYMWFGMHQGSFGGNVKRNETRIHPTQKPIALYEWLLTNYAKPGDKIFDSHIGSGSHPIACNRMGFEFYGTEKDPLIFDKSCEWIAHELRQERMFA